MENPYQQPASTVVDPSLVTIAHFIYALHSLSILIGFLIGPAILLITGFWVIYRVVRGWLALRERKPMPVAPAF